MTDDPSCPPSAPPCARARDSCPRPSAMEPLEFSLDPQSFYQPPGDGADATPAEPITGPLRPVTPVPLSPHGGMLVRPRATSRSAPAWRVPTYLDGQLPR